MGWLEKYKKNMFGEETLSRALDSETIDYEECQKKLNLEEISSEIPVILCIGVNGDSELLYETECDCFKTISGGRQQKSMFDKAEERDVLIKTYRNIEPKPMHIKTENVPKADPRYKELNEKLWVGGLIQYL